MNRRMTENPKKSIPQPNEMDYHDDQGVDEGRPCDKIEKAEFRRTVATV